MSCKKISYITILLIVLSCSVVQAQSDYFKQFAEPVETQLSQSLDTSYSLKKVYEINEFAGSTELTPYPLDDPYRTLTNYTLFAAKADGPNWIFGLYNNTNVVWHTPEPLQCSDIKVYGSMDLNLDGNVDIMVDCVFFGRPNFKGFMYIYSWNGSRAEMISQIKKTQTGRQRNNIKSYAATSFGLVDLNGDGIMEIRGLDPNDSDHWIHWSWNGYAYGDWPSTPSPPKGKYYPADMAEGKVKVEVTKTDSGFTYNYAVKNNPTSKRRLTELYVDHAKPEKKGKAPAGWRFNGIGITNYPFNWKYDNGNTKFMISPGDSLSGFTLYSNAPPGVFESYVRSEHRLPDYNSTYSIEKDRNNIRTNSDRGITLAPGPDPENLDHSEYADSLRSYLDFSCGHGWVTNHGICNSLQAKMCHVAKQLGKGKTKQAVNGMEVFISEVQAQRGQNITEEGYAVLYYNAKYLLDRLPEPSSSVIPQLPAALTVASGQASGAFSADNFSIAGGNVHGVLATSTSAKQGVLNGLQSYQEDNITGSGPAPDVVKGQLNFDPNVLINSVLAHVDQTIPARTSGTFGSPQQPVVLHAQRGLQSSGTISGYGILLVDGQLHVSGTMNWNGLIIQRSRPGVGPNTSVSTNLTINGGMLVYNEGPFGASLQVSNKLIIQRSKAAISNLINHLSF